ncbi:LysM peptidoglycan-binding domain-containing protein [Polycladomyces subterraneus]|uniref:LysM peptidoglycan-binding domain-containing protein n=1 Tax=Polycladomyces subterraneus TaxID=1016997 RepID=A0ABT8IM85_9BACL|nr:LysM domain-containing protein [Polycladomyces subterraneus]MDN4593904.1 LysM peptidoglycan-binding domain-containing protein [Polycladomyces subterraneus]
MKIHIVQSGETLNDLSARYGVSIDKLNELNPQLSDGNGLTPGTKVKIPTGRVKVKNTSFSKSTQGEKESSYHNDPPPHPPHPRRPIVPRIPTPVQPPGYPRPFHPGIPPIPYPPYEFYPPVFPYTPDYQTYYPPMYSPHWHAWPSQSPGIPRASRQQSDLSRTKAVEESPTPPAFEWESAVETAESSSAEY